MQPRETSVSLVACLMFGTNDESQGGGAQTTGYFQDYAKVARQQGDFGQLALGQITNGAHFPWTQRRRAWW